MLDNTHVATASYDRKINIFNYKKGVATLTATSSRAGIACMAITSDENKLISTTLDNSITIWRITKEVFLFNLEQ